MSKLPGIIQNNVFLAWLLAVDHLDNRSASLFFSPCRWTARVSKAKRAERKQISLRQAFIKEWRQRPKLSTVTATSLSHWIVKRSLDHCWPQSLSATTVVKSSKQLMASEQWRIETGKSAWKNCCSQSPPQPIRQASVEKTLLREDQSQTLTIVTPLYCRRKQHHQWISLLNSAL